MERARMETQGKGKKGWAEDRKRALPRAAEGKGSGQVLTPHRLGATLNAGSKYAREVRPLRPPKGAAPTEERIS